MNDDPPMTDAFILDRSDLAYQSARFACRAVDGVGWTSVAIAGDEILDRDLPWPGVTLGGGEDAVRMRVRVRVDGLDGHQDRVGAVEDGISRIAIEPDLDGNGFILAVGFNATGDRECVWWLAPGVRARATGPDRCRSDLLDPGADPPVDLPRGVVLIHPSGRSITLATPCRIGALADARGRRRPALAIPCAGFAANHVHCRIDATPRPDWFLARPTLRLHDPCRDPDTPDDHPEYGRLVLDPARPSRLELHLDWFGRRRMRCSVLVEVSHSLGGRARSRRSALRLERGSNAIDLGDLVLERPGIHELIVRLMDDDGRLLWSERLRLAWDLPHFEPVVVEEADFDEFWNRTLAQLRDRPLDPVERRVDRSERPDWRFWEVELSGWAGSRFTALVYEPVAGPRPLPAIVSSHPGTRGWGPNRGPDGLFGSAIRHDPRFLTIVPLIRGHVPDAEHIPFNHPWWGPLEHRERYVARSWYCAMLRTVDYLAQRDDLVDMSRVVALGGSQGGALALALAGLDYRIDACLAIAPSNCQLHELATGRYPGFGPHPGQVPDPPGIDATVRMLSYFDPANFCARIRCETHIGINVGDHTVHAMGPIAAWKRLTGVAPGQRHLHTGSLVTHQGPQAMAQAKDRVLDRVATAAPPTPSGAYCR